MSAKILKLVSGEFVIADIINESMDSVTLKESLKVVNVFQNDKMGVRFEPFNPFASVMGEEITIDNIPILEFIKTLYTITQNIVIKCQIKSNFDALIPFPHSVIVYKKYNIKVIYGWGRNTPCSLTGHEDL